MELFEFENDRFKWSLRTFPEATAQSSLCKLKEEIREIELDILTGVRNPEEFADALFCLFDAAQRHGITVPEIWEAAKEKLKVNKARRWIKNPDNSYSHIAEDEFDLSPGAVIVVSSETSERLSGIRQTHNRLYDQRKKHG